MHTPRPSFRNAVRRITAGPDAAIYALLAVVLLLQASPRMASLLQSAIAPGYPARAASSQLLLKTAAYCDETGSKSALETVTVQEIPEVASDELASSDTDSEMTLEKDSDTPFATSRSIEESTGNSFLDRLQVGGFRVNRWMAAERRLLDRLPKIARADLERHPWSDGRTTGEGLLISWMNHDILRIERQKTRLSHAVTELTFSVSLRTGDPRRPWAVFGIKAIGRSNQDELHAVRSLSQELVTQSLAQLPEAWVAEVSVVTPVPAVLGGDDNQQYSASWSAGSANPAAFYADECPMTGQSAELALG
jgi:hypothetical protein